MKRLVLLFVLFYNIQTFPYPYSKSVVQIYKKMTVLPWRLKTLSPFSDSSIHPFILVTTGQSKWFWFLLAWSWRLAGQQWSFASIYRPLASIPENSSVHSLSLRNFMCMNPSTIFTQKFKFWICMREREREKDCTHFRNLAKTLFPPGHMIIERKWKSMEAPAVCEWIRFGLVNIRDESNMVLLGW